MSPTITKQNLKTYKIPDNQISLQSCTASKLISTLYNRFIIGLETSDGNLLIILKIEQKFEKFNFLCIINRKNSTRDVHINPRIDHSMDIIIENDIMRANSSSYSLTL